MGDRTQRLTRNENLFREINERVWEIASGHGADLHVYEFYCECSDTDCTLRVELPLPAYERIRADGSRFVIAPGHDVPEIERVIEQTERWWVIEKHGEAGKLAEKLDPRA